MDASCLPHLFLYVEGDKTAFCQCRSYQYGPHLTRYTENGSRPEMAWSKARATSTWPFSFPFPLVPHDGLLLCVYFLFTQTSAPRCKPLPHILSAYSHLFFFFFPPLPCSPLQFNLSFNYLSPAPPYPPFGFFYVLTLPASFFSSS